MNYFKMFKYVGIIDNDINLFGMASSDIDNNCQKSSEALFGVIDNVYMKNDFNTDLSGFILELKKLYKEVGVNLGCLFIERHFNKEFHINFCDTDKLEMKKILNLNGFINIIFNHMWDILIKPDIENVFPDMQNKISLLKHNLIEESGVPEEAINFVLNSAELMKLRYFLIKMGFKCGFFLCLAFNTLHMQLSEEVEKILPGDLQ